MIRSGIFLLALLLAAPTTADDADFSAPDGLRKGGTLHQNLPAPPMAGEPRHSGREIRNYPEQPPVIPHSINLVDQPVGIEERHIYQPPRHPDPSPRFDPR